MSRAEAADTASGGKRAAGAAAAALLLALGAGATARAEPCKIAKFVDLPVTMVGTSPTVPAKINGRDVTFVADSGAFTNTLGTTIAKELNLRLDPAPSWLHVAGIGGETDVSLTTVKTFTFANVPIPNVQFIVSPGAGGHAYAGLLGQNIWGLGDVEYDLGGGAIRLFKVDGCRDKALAYWAGTKPYSSVPITNAEERSKKTFADAFINGQRVRVMLDTGSWSSLMTLRGAARVGLKPDGPGVKRAGVTLGIGSHAHRNWIGPVASFKIGDEEIQNTRLRFGEIELDNADMLLGADFFLSHRIYVANSQRRIYFTYNGGRVFNLDALPAASEPAQKGAAAGSDTTGAAPAAAEPAPDEPKTADAYSRRGAAEAGRHDYERAVADFGKAIALDPTNPLYFYQRARARLSLRQPLLAMGDIEQVLKLKPDDIDALLTRAQLRLADHERKAALADLDQIAATASKPADVRLELARLFLQLDEIDRALTEFDLWIGSHAEDGQMSGALAGRCRARVLADRELDKARADCDRAMRMGPASAQMYDSRALIFLRGGAYDRAIEDYGRALAINPRIALALYGRGVARLRTGQKAEGEADIAAAIAIAPRVAETARKLGIERPAAGA